MKTIGFVDYYLSEWHANNYPKWIREICEGNNLDVCLGYAWAEEYVSPVDGRNTDEWCSEFGVEKCGTLKELCEKSDYIIMLCPSNPEKHLEYAREVFKHGKNTFIDKTFAPDYKTAKEIFAIAEKYNTKFFSCSALRYAPELKKAENCNNVIIYGGGCDISEYIVHHLEMCLKLMSANAVLVKTENKDEHYTFTIAFDNEKTAEIVYDPKLPFGICCNGVYTEIVSDYFKEAIKDIIEFFLSGKCSFKPSETLEIAKIRDEILYNFFRRAY